MYLKFCLTVQSHLHQIQYVHMAHGFPPPFCTGKKFLQDENGKIFLLKTCFKNLFYIIGAFLLLFLEIHKARHEMFLKDLLFVTLY